MSSSPTPCDRSKLQRLMDDQLSAAEYPVLEAHVDHCPACRAELDRMTRSAGKRVLPPARRHRAAEGPYFHATEDERAQRLQKRQLAPEADALAASTGSGLDSAREPPSDGSPALPGRIGRFRIERLLGKGGFGVVYLARDEQLARPVALKVPHAQLVAEPGEAEAYLTEAQIVANLDHPHIVPVYEFGSAEGFPCFIVSKYINGSNLANRIREARPPERDIVHLTATVAEALHYAHQQGLVHRDIKPGNILLDLGGMPFVADFGMALREQDVGQGPRYVGTPAYMSPEQARGEGHRVDGRSDVFSLGVVLYELLTGRRPFQADSRVELLRQIATAEPPPPRHCDPRIATELERICLKAMAKRASERYATAKDLADDLRHYLKVAGDGCRGTGEIGTSGSSPATPAPATHDPAAASGQPSPATPSEPQSLPIVPKGLRSFDAHDADFFLPLLPGPRDREGLPDSLRFWKTRIEERDADNTFAVGLLYGPSGCGKSSLVKAGLLPRLSDQVLTVYVEATAEETENRLLGGLRKRCPALADDMTSVRSARTPEGKARPEEAIPAELKSVLASLRRGQGIAQGKKVLIVLDQFEQWLHARRDEEHPELVEALRQCDGGRVQCLLLVRDDFWLAVSRFMKALEIRLLEGKNSALVDLFDREHAVHVLAAFGRAFGKLPERSSTTSKDQREFLNQAVAGLAEENKIVCVRLALFAEMMKARPWTPAALRSVGGTEGVGVTFLDETFSSASAPPAHRYHQQAARAVLKALLPESASDLKGHMRPQAELLAASGYSNRPREFADLLAILDGEIRLITPTDPEGRDEGGGMKDEQERTRDEVGGMRKTGDDNSGSSLILHLSSFRYYQLTHDYLVPAVRDWLTRKQKETRRGRAELLLADRAAVWNARPENRQLPSLLSWLRIRWLTRKQHWTSPQRRMMTKASRYHVVRGVATAVLLALIGWGAYEGHGMLQAHALRDQLRNANTADVPAIVRETAPYRRWLAPLLRDAYQEAEKAGEPRKQLHASLALLPMDAGQVPYLYGRLLSAEPHELAVLRDAMAPYKDALRDKLWQVASQSGPSKEARLCAAAALASYDPDRATWSRTRVVEDLVTVDAVYLGLWCESFRPVRGKLVEPLAAIFRDRKPERGSERTLATNLLADYAADQPRLLADLLLDADEKQFPVLFRKLTRNREIVLAVLEREMQRSIDEPAVEVFKVDAAITDKDEQGQIRDSRRAVTAEGAVFRPTRFKVFPVAFKRGRRYQITMSSKELDSLLLLLDKDSHVLASHYGGPLDCRLAFTPALDETLKISAITLGKTGAFSLVIHESDASPATKERSARRRANAAVALLRLDRPDPVWPLLKHGPDPTVRSCLIDRLGPLGADADLLIRRLDEESDVSARRALVLSLGGFSDEQLLPARRLGLVAKLLTVYENDPDSGLHAAAEWLLRQGGHADKVKALEQKLRTKEQPLGRWYVNSEGQTMVRIPGPVEFLMGSPPGDPRADLEMLHKVRIPRNFAVSAKTVTVGQYRQFDKDHGYDLPPQYTHLPELPMVTVNWYRAAAYCNWLSKQERIPEDQWCYEIEGNTVRLRPNYLQLTGYRLPTEAEMEYAIRAGAKTSWFFGEVQGLLSSYAWTQGNSREVPWPVGQKMPNDLGLFDALGNVLVWCQDAYKANDRRGFVEDREGSLSVDPQGPRLLRGGSFLRTASSVRCACRVWLVPALRSNDMGFRLARTYR